MYAPKTTKLLPFVYDPPTPPFPPHGHPFQALCKEDVRVTGHLHTSTYHADLERMLVDIAKRIETGGV